MNAETARVALCAGGGSIGIILFIVVISLLLSRTDVGEEMNGTCPAGHDFMLDHPAENDLVRQPILAILN
jgi:hypothetical protein